MNKKYQEKDIINIQRYAYVETILHKLKYQISITLHTSATYSTQATQHLQPKNKTTCPVHT